MPRFDRLEIDAVPEPSREGKASKGNPEFDEKYWLQLALDNRREGHYENALRYYSRALEMDKSLIAGWLGQVQMLVMLDEYKEAELWSRKALELFRNHSELLAARAQAQCRKGDRKIAHELSDASLRQDGESAYRWLVRGEILVAGREQMDRHCFDKASLLDPDWLVEFEIAELYMYYDRYSLALPRYRQALEKQPESAHAWYRKALCERQLDMKEQAKSSLKRCLEINPNHVEGQRTLALLPDHKWSVGRALKRFFGRS